MSEHSSSDRVAHAGSADPGRRPLVSVVITTRNRCDYLKEALDSVYAVQGGSFELEVIVIDDGSTDGTPALLSSYPVRRIRTEGVGMAAARNLGLAAFRGDFVTLLDDDDVWLPQNISAQLAVFERHPEYAAVIGQFQLTREDKQPIGAPEPRGPLSSGHIFEEILTYFPQVATIVTRAAAAREAGEMDPSLTGDTDWDWLLRIAARHPIGRIEQPVLLFRQRDGAEESQAWRRFPAMLKIFQRHTASLALPQRLKLQRALWRHRGWWAWNFLRHAETNRKAGRRDRAYKSLAYAFRASPAHALIGCIRQTLR